MSHGCNGNFDSHAAKKPVRTILESLQQFAETSFLKKKKIKNRSRTDFRFSTYLFDVTKNFLAARHALDNSSQRGFWSGKMSG
jgi:hypothetical protein